MKIENDGTVGNDNGSVVIKMRLFYCIIVKNAIERNTKKAIIIISLLFFMHKYYAYMRQFENKLLLWLV